MAENNEAIRAGKIWFCKIGEHDPLFRGADAPMRDAVYDAYEKITGQPPAFIFSGWGGELTEGERAVVENRMPREEATPPAAPVAEDVRDALRGLLLIVDDSRGVDGYHLNGDIAEWDYFPEVDAARRALLASQPAKVPTRILAPTIEETNANLAEVGLRVKVADPDRCHICGGPHHELPETFVKDVGNES